MSAPFPPSGFSSLHIDTETWWVKEDWGQSFPDTLKNVWTSRNSVNTPTLGGRGALQHLPLSDGGQAFIRRYRRGGFVRHFMREVYWERPFRPFAELTCTEVARQRGIPTIEILAAGVQHLRFGRYRGVLISREARGFSNLWEWLQTRPTPTTRQAIFAAVVHTIKQLRAAGIFHADLNLTNVLVRITGATIEVLVIDFDKGQIFPASLPIRYHHAMLRRFQRSLRKLDPQQQFVSSAEEGIFRPSSSQ